MVVLRLFASAREAAGGIGRADVEGQTVAEVLAEATRRYGPEFEAVLRGCRIWCNGESTTGASPVGAGDEVAVIPPVSGGT